MGFDKWRLQADQASGKDIFLYAVKANQYFTHMKQLNVDGVFKQRWRSFWELCCRLQPHLGCVLFQFPAKFRLTKAPEKNATLERLKQLGALLPSGGRFAFEFRH